MKKRNARLLTLLMRQIPAMGAGHPLYWMLVSRCFAGRCVNHRRWRMHRVRWSQRCAAPYDWKRPWDFTRPTYKQPHCLGPIAPSWSASDGVRRVNMLVLPTRWHISPWSRRSQRATRQLLQGTCAWIEPACGSMGVDLEDGR
jgi:hypothetical protein